MEIVIVAIIAALGQIAAHYFPWHKLFRGGLPKVAAYSIGTAFMALPATGWMVWAQEYRAAIVLWSAIAASGLAVMGAYALDGYLDHKARAEDLEEQINHYDQNVE